ncbi:uncharacterized protein LOC124186484 [Neodiprion fabricii]|uniref:uncharacterized protein LOC124186484 n=1 Tax=Neodiprion fabricii TaxID=2872261 RepID=UPI001ED94147|nr:uncharacterized protein LOC124186484 [Neodiprion fabricii]
MSNSSITWGILDMPDEILLEIIGYLNARDMLLLSKSCKRFHSLVFDEKKSLRHLDFSEEGYLNSISDVQQYFNSKKKYEHILKINVSNMYYTRPGDMLNTIGKAKNLVEINIIGLKFIDVMQLAIFLTPMKCLRILSIDWPTSLIDNRQCCEMLKLPFNRLTKLTMTLCDVKYKTTLIHALELCQQLRELRLLQRHENILPREGDPWLTEPKKLENLQIAACCGSDTEFLRRIIVDMLPNPEQWMEFKSYDAVDTHHFYFEKNVEVSQKLRAKVLMDFNPFTQSLQKVGCGLFFQFLLREVVEITNSHKALEKFCCLSNCTLDYMCLLKINEAKQLLKNPRHQISYLYLSHNIEPECDVYLVGSAFPCLTKLILSNLVKHKVTSQKETDLHTEVAFKKRRTSLVNDAETPDLNSSFAKLVKNTPHVSDLTLSASTLKENEYWDLTALYLISGWTSLTTLHLVNLPIRSGKFLIEIGKQCKNLEKLKLENLGHRGACCYKNELYQMLAHCLNLKDFSIQQDNFGQTSTIFTMFGKNRKLRRIYIKSLGTGNHTTGDLVLPIKSLVQSCELVLLIYEIQGITQATCDKLKSVLQRLKNELHRPKFQFEIVRWDYGYNGYQKPPRNFNLHFVHKDLLLPYRFTDSLFRLDCL